MSDSSVPVIVLSRSRDDVEYFNKLLRDAGHPVHCTAVDSVDRLDDALASQSPQLLILFAESFMASIREVAKRKQAHSRMLPLIVVRQTADEDEINDAIQAGANDLVSAGHRERLAAVCERELRSFRLERALNDTLKSASQYKKQLQRFMAGSTDAIAQVQEGIVVEANRAWAEIFANDDPDGGNWAVPTSWRPGSHRRPSQMTMAGARCERTAIRRN